MYALKKILIYGDLQLRPLLKPAESTQHKRQIYDGLGFRLHDSKRCLNPESNPIHNMQET